MKLGTATGACRHGLTYSTAPETISRHRASPTSAERRARVRGRCCCGRYAAAADTALTAEVSDWPPSPASSVAAASPPPATRITPPSCASTVSSPAAGISIVARRHDVGDGAYAPCRKGRRAPSPRRCSPAESAVRLVQRLWPCGRPFGHRSGRPRRRLSLRILRSKAPIRRRRRRCPAA